MNFKTKIIKATEQNISTKKALLENCSEQIENSAIALAGILKNGGKLLFCGNGGSAADSQHLAAELVVRLRSHINRPALPALALTVDPSIMTAGGNDIGFENVFARCVEAYGQKSDALIGISTSGNSTNVIKAIEMAKSKQMLVVNLLGCLGGKMKGMGNFDIIVPSDTTARIQECHIFIGHLWCEIIEETLFPELF